MPTSNLLILPTSSRACFLYASTPAFLVNTSGLPVINLNPDGDDGGDSGVVSSQSTSGGSQLSLPNLSGLSNTVSLVASPKEIGNQKRLLIDLIKGSKGQSIKEITATEEPFQNMPGWRIDYWTKPENKHGDIRLDSESKRELEKVCDEYKVKFQTVIPRGFSYALKDFAVAVSPAIVTIGATVAGFWLVGKYGASSFAHEIARNKIEVGKLKEEPNFLSINQLDKELIGASQLKKIYTKFKQEIDTNGHSKKGVFIFGKPGSGKTVVTQAIIDHEQSKNPGLLVFEMHPSMGGWSSFAGSSSDKARFVVEMVKKEAKRSGKKVTDVIFNIQDPEKECLSIPLVGELMQINSMFQTLKVAQELLAKEEIRLKPFVTSNSDLYGSALINSGLNENKLGSLIRRLGHFEPLGRPTEQDLIDQFEAFGIDLFRHSNRNDLQRILCGNFDLNPKGFSKETIKRIILASLNLKEIYTTARKDFIEEFKQFLFSRGASKDNQSMERFTTSLGNHFKNTNPNQHDTELGEAFIEFCEDFFKRNAIGVLRDVKISSE